MTMDRVLISLTVSLGMTLVLELAFAAIVGVRTKKDLLLVCAVNVATNPPAVLIHLFCVAYAFCQPMLSTIGIEAAVILAEAYLYKRYSGIRRPFLFALTANLFSFGIGAILNILF